MNEGGRERNARIVGMAVLSAAVLLSQVALTRIFSVAQSYHFAFLVISLALLGFGASGSLLALRPSLQRSSLWPWYALGTGVTTVLGYLFVNLLPFDSYAIAWDPVQAYLLIADLLALAVPFTFAGALIGSMLSQAAADAGRIYGANLLGSGAGAILAPLVISGLGTERALLLCGGLGAAAALLLSPSRRAPGAVALGAAVVAVVLVVTLPAPFQVRPSVYKRLSQVRLDPEARILATRQDARSRLDIVMSPTLHSAQGLSLSYAGELPPQAGLLIDGDALLPVPDAQRVSPTLAAALPLAVPQSVRPGADVLLLGSGGGLEARAALGNGARQVTVVEPNQLVYDALRTDLRRWAGLADDPRVRLQHEELRAFAEADRGRYDLVELTLTENYRPISSGAFTLTESFPLTAEGFRSYLRLCGDDGLFVVTRWLQARPTESLRTLSLIIEALEGRDPLPHVFAFRTFQTVTFVVKPTPFSPSETELLLAGVDRLRYDVVLSPRVPPDAVNRYARLERAIDHELALQLAKSRDRPSFYAGYDFDVSPPTDDRPYFFHFFRLEQSSDVFEELGRRWQPFGGSGYFVLVALLAFAVGAALVFILLPIALRPAFRGALGSVGKRRALGTLGYFTVLGLAFLFVEIASIQHAMLMLGHPTLALATVIGALLVSSGLGSSLSARLPWRSAIVALAVLVAVHPWLVALSTPVLLGLPVFLRVVAVVAVIAPIGFLMGVPFARGIAALAPSAHLVPWAWAANGSASVISGVLASMLAVSFGFSSILLVAAGLYVAAALLAGRLAVAGADTESGEATAVPG